MRGAALRARTSAGWSRRRRCARRGGRGRPAGRRSAASPGRRGPCRMPPVIEWSPPMATARVPASAMPANAVAMRSMQASLSLASGSGDVAEVVDDARLPGREAERPVHPPLQGRDVAHGARPEVLVALGRAVAGAVRHADQRDVAAGGIGIDRAAEERRRAPPVEALDHHPVVRREAAEVGHRGASVPSGRGGRARRPRRDGERQRERRLGLKSSTGLRPAAATKRGAGGSARGMNTAGSCRSARGGVAAPDRERERANRRITVRLPF